MYKVLIVDDEQKICLLIKHLIDWNNLGIKLVGMAHNSSDAMKIVAETNPDIVFTDIRMPGQDGLELIRLIKAKDEKIDFIIISGYRDFDYARRAIQYGAEDYILKPIKKIDLENAIQRIVERRDSRNYLNNQNASIIRNSFIERLVNSSCEEVNFINPDLFNTKYDLNFNKPDYFAYSLKIDVLWEEVEHYDDYLKKRILPVIENSFSSSDINHCSCVVDDIIYGIINCDANDHSKLKQLMRYIILDIKNLTGLDKETHITIGLSTNTNKIETISEKFKESTQAVQNRLLAGVDRVIEFIPTTKAATVNDYVSQALQQKIIMTMDTLLHENLGPLLNEIEKTVLETRYSTGLVCLEVCNRIFELFIMKAATILESELVNELRNDYTSKSRMAPSIQGLVLVLQEFINRVFNLSISSIRKREKKPIQDAKIFINNHYSEQLSLEDVAQHVGLNPSYFSYFFKKETGITFVEFITLMRFENAKALLVDGKDCISDIAKAVGFNDDKYFSNVFRKLSGISPSQYRRLYQ